MENGFIRLQNGGSGRLSFAPRKTTPVILGRRSHVRLYAILATPVREIFDTEDQMYHITMTLMAQVKTVIKLQPPPPPPPRDFSGFDGHTVRRPLPRTDANQDTVTARDGSRTPQLRDADARYGADSFRYVPPTPQVHYATVRQGTESPRYAPPTPQVQHASVGQGTMILEYVPPIAQLHEAGARQGAGSFRYAPRTYEFNGADPPRITRPGGHSDRFRGVLQSPIARHQQLSSDHTYRHDDEQLPQLHHHSSHARSDPLAPEQSVTDNERDDLEGSPQNSSHSQRADPETSSLDAAPAEGDNIADPAEGDNTADSAEVDNIADILAGASITPPADVFPDFSERWNHYCMLHSSAHVPAEGGGCMMPYFTDFGGRIS